MEVLSISALDIFASALGVFVLMAIMLFPYYLKQPAREIEAQGAVAELAAAGLSVSEAEKIVAETKERKKVADERLSEARDRLRMAETAMAQALKEPEPARAEEAAPRNIEKKTGVQETPLSISDLDLVFVMDTTGSMRDELADLQSNLVGVIRILSRMAASLRVGFVAFKDTDAAYLTQEFPLSPMNDRNVERLVDFVQGLSALGGGDIPEPVNRALGRALEMPWRSEAQGRIIVIGDASVHEESRQRTLQMAEAFRTSSRSMSSPRTVSSIFTGRHPRARAFFKNLAEAGGGDFMAHQGQMIESVLLSILPDPRRGRAGP
jgi:Mg-chelatase subunit ChlD